MNTRLKWVSPSKATNGNQDHHGPISPWVTISLPFAYSRGSERQRVGLIVDSQPPFPGTDIPPPGKTLAVVIAPPMAYLERQRNSVFTDAVNLAGKAQPLLENRSGGVNANTEGDLSSGQTLIYSTF